MSSGDGGRAIIRHEVWCGHVGPERVVPLTAERNEEAIGSQAMVGAGSPRGTWLRKWLR
ncbi:hypothetical protein ACERK3_17550 [Phycisphaerales bacterium AB-hyl4]|uniref:Uncharacterized protein n=1 Tax=Natronomicrosphaera hydrolytica TaxID=3242702 RepID=A0ABV4UC53_9BACT